MTGPTRSVLALACGFGIALSTSLSSLSADAAEFSLGGYYRLRLELFNSLSAGVSLNGYPTDHTTGYWQHRVRLDPRIKLNDNVSFFTQIDLLDNVLAGDNPELDGPFYGGASPLPEFLSRGVLPEGVVAGAPGTLAQVGDYRRNIAVKRAWGDVLTGVGEFKFGRMGSHWGLGMLANDGNGIDDDFGDTVDRLMFITKAGPIYIVPIIDRISEGAYYETSNGRAADWQNNIAPLSQGGSDVNEYILVAVFRGELNSGGIYGVFRNQPSTDSRVWVGDLWGKTRVGPLAVELEAAYVNGQAKNFIAPNSPPSITANQWGFAVETSAPLRPFTPGFNFGGASGDGAQEGADGSFNNFVFSRDYHIAFLLFRYVVPDRAPHAVTDALYGKPWIRWEPFDNFDVEAALVYAQTMTAMPTYNSGSYGTELDLSATWKLYEGFEASFRYGALDPGTALKPITATSGLDTIVHGIEGRFLIRF